MLPPGHFAGAFLTAKAVSQISPQLDNPYFLLLSTFFGTFPDFDFFYIFYKTKKILASNDHEHRKFVTHSPLVYLVASVFIFVAFPHISWITIAFLIGTLTHFILDSFTAEGIPWLWPFTDKNFAFAKKLIVYDINEQNFFKHWFGVIKTYYFRTRLAKFEMVLIIIASIILIKDLIYAQ